MTTKSEQQGSYSHRDAEASRGDPFAKFKFAWLDQVLADPKAKSAFRTAYLIATKYLHRETLEAFPAQATIAGELGLEERQVRSHIRALERRGYLLSRRGGKGRSNRYFPVLIDHEEIAARDMFFGIVGGSVDRQQTAGMTGNKLPPNPSYEPGRGAAASPPPLPTTESNKGRASLECATEGREGAPSEARLPDDASEKEDCHRVQFKDGNPKLLSEINVPGVGVSYVEDCFRYKSGGLWIETTQNGSDDYHRMRIEGERIVEDTVHLVTDDEWPGDEGDLYAATAA